MEMWDHRPVPRHRRNNPSFSSSLLDAIYRSIDAESDSAGKLTGGEPDPAAKKPRAVPVSENPVTPLNYHSSSSSSDADSARIGLPRPKPSRPGPVLTRSDRIRSDPLPPIPNPNPTKNSISIKKKLRDLKKSTSPSSPGAKLAGFLNSLFTPSNHKKAKISTAESPSPSPSSASSYSRSCLSKTPSTHRSTGSNRAVRFSPVGVIVGEDCRPCGEKFLFDGEAVAAAAAERRRRRRVVEELMKGLEMEAESGEDSDDGSEDLFELENLVGINGGGGGGGRGSSDELPVYGTTDLGMNCAIAKGLVV